MPSLASLGCRYGDGFCDSCLGDVSFCLPVKYVGRAPLRVYDPGKARESCHLAAEFISVKRGRYLWNDPPLIFQERSQRRACRVR